jgi:hypothetical protein
VCGSDWDSDDETLFVHYDPDAYEMDSNMASFCSDSEEESYPVEWNHGE